MGFSILRLNIILLVLPVDFNSDFGLCLNSMRGNEADFGFQILFLLGSSSIKVLTGLKE